MTKQLEKKLGIIDQDYPPLDPSMKIIDSIDGIPLDKFPQTYAGKKIVSSVNGIPTTNLHGRTVREVSHNDSYSIFPQLAVYISKVKNYFFRK